MTCAHLGDHVELRLPELVTNQLFDYSIPGLYDILWFKGERREDDKAGAVSVECDVSLGQIRVQKILPWMKRY